MDRATFVFTSDFEGFQRPCGCAAGQHGGLLRLATITQTLGAALSGSDSSVLADFSVSLPGGLTGKHKLWLVDCGNFTDASRRLPGLRVKAHLVAMAQAGAGSAVAVVINQNELLLSEGQAEIAFAGSPVELAGCNLAVTVPGMELKKSVQFAQNWFVVGLAAMPQTELAEGQGGWWELHDPLESVLQALSEIPGDANVVVVATHQPAEVISELQKLNIRAVVGGQSASFPDSSAGVAPLLSTPIGRGRRLQLLSFDKGFASGYGNWSIVAGEEWPDDPEVLDILQTWQAEFNQQLETDMAALYGIGGFGNISWGMDSKYLPPTEATKINFDGLHFVGTKQCQGCHSAEYDVWQQSRHAIAWDSLVEAAEQETLDCLQCHTTGLLEPGGYLPFAHNEDLVSVGCESCHGAGSDHLEWAGAGADGNTEKGITPGSLDACLACHDSYNSPGFDAKIYWDKVRH